ncbi:YdeI/OmpD-associated family protein [Chitinophaga sp. GCM10012297]|uniref:YdeI/OmpD-associated family protein n=1 Tax=Chitinophaga chungangae TaxID=2821488 RepID=A0ABS3YF37_9BACT|nr:YdeI/OmpD-associated family protein [Chitinophaga chungangae]
MGEGLAEIFERLSRSAEKVILQGLVMAKRPETRIKRMGRLG